MRRHDWLVVFTRSCLHNRVTNVVGRGEGGLGNGLRRARRSRGTQRKRRKAEELTIGRVFICQSASEAGSKVEGRVGDGSFL